MSLTEEVTLDALNIAAERENKMLAFPVFGEIFQGGMQVVIVPTTVSVLKNKIPLIGGLFAGLSVCLINDTVGEFKNY